MLRNEISEYAADMNIVLTYYHFMDNWQDDKNVVGFAGMKALKRDFNKISKQYPRQCQVIKESLNGLKKCETNKEMNIDIVSGLFGEIMAELFIYQEDMWEENLRKVGFFLGKFIYIIDAYEDIDKDLKKSSYNPLTSIYGTEFYEENCKNMLTMMMADCANEFEKLPCLIDIDILRNVLYNGVWTKFEAIQKEKNIEEGIKHDNGSI
jgi:hypothetical protein